MKLKKVFASESQWQEAKSNIVRIMEDGSDLEDTDYFDYVNGLEQEVAESLGLYLEPSVQAGRGDMYVYDENNGSAVVAVVDYEEYEEDEYYRILDSSSESEYKNKFSEYLKALI